uniref:Metastasis-associated protein MTA1-like n=2 Tax=Hirondellea gigas TaxID=1518452 RepID=A0A6A7FUY4_9CRUS
MTNNMYRVGDYVYFETSSGSPYQIRRIEELIKTPAGNVEAKVMCFYRRRDIPSHLLALANLKHHSGLDDDGDGDDGDPTAALCNTTGHYPHLQQSSHTRLLGGTLGSPTSATSSRASAVLQSHSNNTTTNNSISSSSATITATSTTASVDRLPSSSATINASTPTQPTTTSSSSTSSAVEDRLSNSNSTSSTTTTTTTSISSASSDSITNSTSTNNGTSAASPTLNNVERPSRSPSLPTNNNSNDRGSLTEDQRHQLRHRELFLTRQIETLPATHIRGKCAVTLLNETETLSSYVTKEDTFFYSLVYDPQAKTLLADKGEIRIGPKYQAEVQEKLKDGVSDGRVMNELEELVWTPHSNGLIDRQIDQFLVVSRSVGTFARALDCSSSVKQPSLHMSAAAASRDVTLFEAMSLLHKQQYDLSRALSCLVPGTGPLLCRDQMEEWAASEANLFEEALDKYGKDFNDIRQDFLPWKTLKNIIEYYYMWKTTDRYVQQKRVKAVEAESKLKQVYIPNYNKPNSSAIANTVKAAGLVNGNANGASQAVACEGCSVGNSNQWYSWGPAQKQSRLCADCWGYWKKLGGLKKASRSAKEEEEAGMRPVVKTRNAFYIHTSPALRVMRRLACNTLRRRRAARNPTSPINATLVRQESLVRLGGRTLDSFTPWLKQLASLGGGAGSGTLKDVALKLGQLDTYCPPWLHVPANKKRGTAALLLQHRTLPIYHHSNSNSAVAIMGVSSRQSHMSYPIMKSPITSDGNYGISAGGGTQGEIPLLSSQHHLLKRRPHQETNGTEGAPPSKRAKESSDPPLDPYRLSQLGVNPPPGLTVTPIGMNGGTNTPPPPSNMSSTTIAAHSNSSSISGSAARLSSSAVQHQQQNTGTPPPTPPPPYHSTHHNTTSATLSNNNGAAGLTSVTVGGASVTALPTPVNAAGQLSQLQHAGGGRAKMATMSRLSGRPRIISWMDAPDDVYFYSTAAIKNQRRSLTIVELKRAARRPWRRLLQLPLSLQQQQQQQMVHASQIVQQTTAAGTISTQQQASVQMAASVGGAAVAAAGGLNMSATVSPITIAPHLTALD